MKENLYSDYLAHHGVKGMKWGKYLMAGKNVAKKVAAKSVDQLKGEYQEAKKNQIKAFAKFDAGEVAKSELKKQMAEARWKDSKIGERIDSRKTKGKNLSHHQKKLAAQYRKQGMSEKDAEIAAYKRARTEKILAIAAVTAVAAIAISQANKHKGDADFIIPSGTTMQHITLNKDKGVSDAFYVSYTKKDKKLYEGMYGGYQLNNGKRNVYAMTTKTNKQIKGAGLISGKKTAQELIDSNPEYAKTLRDALHHKHLTSTLKMPGYKNAMNATAGKGKLNREGYLAINTALNDHSKSGEKAARMLQDELRKKGYGTMSDTNDMFISGYKTQNPLIMLNGKYDLSNREVRTITPKEGRKKSIRYIAQIGVAPVAIALGKGYAKGRATKPFKNKAKARIAERQIINEYRKEHPTSKLTDKRIIELQLRR